MRHFLVLATSPFSPFNWLNGRNMTSKNQGLLTLTDALAELNRARLQKDANAGMYAPSTGYGYASTGRIPAERKGRHYYVRRSDLPLIAARLPAGRRRSPSAA